MSNPPESSAQEPQDLVAAGSAESTAADDLVGSAVEAELQRRSSAVAEGHSWLPGWRASGGLGDRVERAATAELQRRRAAAALEPRLLQSLHIENVKALAGDHLIPLAPLTLIYGPNAAGKSTILQSLQLLAQSVQADGFEPRGPLINLRDFGAVASSSPVPDQGMEVSVGIDFGMAVGEHLVYNPSGDSIEDDDDLAGTTVPTRSLNLGSESLPVRVACGMKLAFHEQGDHTSRSLWLGDGAAEVSQPYPQVSVHDDYRDYDLCWHMDLTDVNLIDGLLSAIQAWNDSDRLPDNPWEDQQLIAFQKWAPLDVERLQIAKGLLESGKALSAALMHAVEPGWEDPGLRTPASLLLVIKPNGSLSADQRLAPVDPGDLSQSVTDELNRARESWARGDAMSFGMQAMPSMLRAVADGGRTLLVDRMTVFGPIRPKPRPVYLDDDSAESSSLALIRRLHDEPELLERVNQRLGPDMPYSIEIERLVGERSGIPAGLRFELTDMRTNAKVTLADVGFGVSQALPIYVECLASSNRVICIEQPELHLHPKLQSNLGDLFVESIKEQGNQIIAETHSENILLRVRRLVREGTLTPDDVAVVYVDNTPGGVEIRRLRLGSNGGLLDPWPTGFFDESLNDLLGGWR